MALLSIKRRVGKIGLVVMGMTVLSGFTNVEPLVAEEDGQPFPKYLNAAWIKAQADGREPDDFPGARSVTGMVFFDSNRNGRRDVGEGGIEGIQVMVGWETAVSQADGTYGFESEEPFHVVSLSFPSNTWPTHSWFRRMYREKEAGIDFGLAEDKGAPPFLFVQFTDAHGEHPQTMPMLRRQCEGLPIQPRFYVCTGDQRSGDPSVRDIEDVHTSFQWIGANLARFGAPLFMVPGNHDTVGYGRANKGMTKEELASPFFLHGAWERYVCPARWSFSHSGIRFLGVPWSLVYSDAAAQRHVEPTEAVIGNWIGKQTAGLPTGTRTILFAHEPTMAARLVEKYGLTLGLAGDTHEVGRHHRGKLHPVDILVAGTCQLPLDKKGRLTSTMDGYPQGSRLILVEKDRIDTFYLPLAADMPTERVIMVHEPLICPGGRSRFYRPPAPGRITVRGQVLDLENGVKSVAVTLEGETVAAQLHRRRLWVDFEAELNLEDPKNYLETLAVRAVLPDGAYGVRPGRDWKTRKRE